MKQLSLLTIFFAIIVPVLFRSIIHESENLRTIIVIAGVHQRFGSKPSRLLQSTNPLNVLTLARHQPLYVALRLRRDLCFW